MIRVAVCEDYEANASQILSFLSEYQKETGASLRTDLFHDGQQLLFNYKTDYDILLLDIEMPKSTAARSRSKPANTFSRSGFSCLCRTKHNRYGIRAVPFSAKTGYP